MGVVSCGTTMLDQGVFQNIGAVTWDTTAKTAGFTAVSGNGYFVNTTSGAITVTLPSSPSAGDIVGIKDYANTAATNNITIGRNGSNIQGQAIDFIINTEGRSVVLVYVDGTQGWKVTSGSQASDIQGSTFIQATGGTITCCGDYKIHTFTGPGTFTVTQLGNGPTVPTGGPNNVDYLVVAGGAGGGGEDSGAGGGAGGYRESSGTASGCYTVSPLGSGVSALPVSVTGYPITVGGGGTAGNTCGSPNGGPGSNSIFSTITSAGGGGGGEGGGPAANGLSGGSGGGAGGGSNTSRVGGAGNTPPTSPPQGNSGGDNAGAPVYGAGGGGGASAAGANGTTGDGGDGGNGAANSITGSSVTRAGGGGGGTGVPQQPLAGVGGTGGGGDAGYADGPSIGTPGTSNTGGGGGGSGSTSATGGSGGSGIVIIRYKFQ